MWQLVAAVAAPAVAGIVGGVIMQGKANDMETDVSQSAQAVEAAIAGRQDVINTADDIRALKSQLTNQYANLGVATESAKIQMEQTDLALANMVEGMTSSGGSASATALARAASESKRSISADIQKQEAANQKLQAQGAAQLQQQRIALDQSALQAEERAFAIQEEREVFDINRLQSEADYFRNQQQAYEDASSAAFLGAVTGSASVAGSAAGSGAFG
jgi:hypothetical protein